jgi:competence protein ComEC
MNWRRVIYYLLLNVLVSVMVTGAILFYYDRGHRADCALTPAFATLAGSTALPPASGGVKVNIVSIIGAGTAGSEIAVLQNIGTEALVLTGWQLKNSRGDSYTFPQLTLYPNGTVQVHTAAGHDTAVDLYWGRSGPVWTTGELVTLYDATGAGRAFYSVP